MGGAGDAKALELYILGPNPPPNSGVNLFSTGALWNNTFYIAGGGMPLKSFPFNAGSATPLVQTPSQSSTPPVFGFPGATPSVSANGTTNGIVWLLQSTAYCTNGASACGPSILRAYDAGTLAELWDSTLVSSDAAGYAVKFTLPTVANGKVYVGTRGNNTGGLDGSTSAPGELDVYGLKPN
jgi:hypothetical protein